MKGQKQSNQDRIRQLIKAKGLCFSQKKQQKCTYNFEQFKSVEVGESSLIGKICGGVVVDKNESSKQLILHLIVTYDHSKIINISINKFCAFIKDYQLKADLSIFTYLNNFKQIQIGTFVNAWVRRIQKRNDKTYFQMYLNRQTDFKFSNVKLGVAKDNIRIPQTVLKVYEKQQMLPMNFQILYYPNYDNPGFDKEIQKGLNVEPITSLHSISNLATLRKLQCDYNRIRHIQDRTWRDQHLDLGLQCMKSGNNQGAIQCFNVALRFDKQYIDIYIAKACAFMNMNNISQGLKQIKQALKIDPNNMRALKYYDQFQKQIGIRHQQYNSKKHHSNSRYDLVYKK